MKNKTLAILAITLLSVLAAQGQIAQGGVYKLDQSVIASGGGTSADAGNTYKVDGTAGQSAAGTTAYGGSYVVKGGFWTSAPFAPTAAEVGISGRVLTANGRGLLNARVLITDGKGQTRSVLTSTFGNFHFDGLTAGETVVIAVSSKRLTFAPQVISLTESISDLTLVAQ